MKLKRVVLAYSTNPPIMDYMKRAFERAGVEAYCFDVQKNNSWFDRLVIHNLNKQAHNFRILPKDKTFFNDHPLSHLHYRGAKLVELIDRTSPDLVLIMRGIRFTEEALRKVRQRTTLFGWWIENEARVDEPIAEAHLFDHYFFMSTSCMEEVKKRGFHNLSLLRHSVDSEAFYPIDCPKRFDWCFVGSGTERRRTFIKKALEVSDKAAIYGKSLFNEKKPRLSPRTVVGRKVLGKDLVRLYNESKIVVDTSSWLSAEKRNKSGVNMRTLEVPACGTLLLTDGSEDIEELVTPGRHVIVYEGPEDFAEKLDYYIRNDSEREKIAREGYEYVTANHSYDKTIEKLIEVYNLYGGQSRANA